MSHLMRKLVKNIENDERDEADLEQKENQEQVVQVKPKRTMRGKTAALLASLKADGEEDDEDIKGSKGGVYATQISQTKKEAQHIQKNFEDVDKAIVVESMQENLKSKKTASSDSDDSANSSDQSSDEDKTFKKKKHLNSSDRYSPPPPPVATVTRRRSGRQSVVEKQLMQLERNSVNLKTTASLNISDQMIDIESDHEEETVSVKVLTASGLKRFTVKENEPFKTIYEKLSKLEEKSIESLILMLKDKKIGFNETPKSIGLKNYDIIECGKHAAPVIKERIRVVDDKKADSNETVSADEVIVMLQTLEGRKSRVKYIIRKDEKLMNCMRKYCQDKKLDPSLHILEFDGDLVEADDTPNSLDLDGGEMFDVKKSGKALSEVIRQNKGKYEFDADILLA